MYVVFYKVACCSGGGVREHCKFDNKVENTFCCINNSLIEWKIGIIYETEENR